MSWMPDGKATLGSGLARSPNANVLPGVVRGVAWCEGRWMGAGRPVRPKRVRAIGAKARRDGLVPAFHLGQRRSHSSPALLLSAAQRQAAVQARQRVQRGRVSVRAH